MRCKAEQACSSERLSTVINGFFNSFNISVNIEFLGMMCKKNLFDCIFDTLDGPIESGRFFTVFSLTGENKDLRKCTQLRYFFSDTFTPKPHLDITYRFGEISFQ